MRSHLFVRLARQEDASEFLEWSKNTKHNEFDSEVVRYPSTVTWCVYDRHGALAYMPMQSPLVMDSLASRPGASKAEIAMALKELTQTFVTQAHIKGAGEVLFFGSEEGTNLFAQNQMFEKLPYTVYRLRVKDTEK